MTPSCRFAHDQAEERHSDSRVVAQYSDGPAQRRIHFSPGAFEVKLAQNPLLQTTRFSTIASWAREQRRNARRSTGKKDGRNACSIGRSDTRRTLRSSASKSWTLIAAVPAGSHGEGAMTDHPQVEVMIDDRVVEVDELLAPLVEAL